MTARKSALVRHPILRHRVEGGVIRKLQWQIAGLLFLLIPYMLLIYWLVRQAVE